MVMPRDVTVEDAYKMCDHLEKDIKAKLPNTNVTIHVELCNVNDCVRCEITVCDIRMPNGEKATR
jgi:divalent metal cation (Fe/Co/Zn/Cd) transporter